MATDNLPKDSNASSFIIVGFKIDIAERIDMKLEGRTGYNRAVIMPNIETVREVMTLNLFMNSTLSVNELQCKLSVFLSQK